LGLLFYRLIYYFDTSALEKFDTIADAVFFAINDANYARLNNEFGAFDARRGSNI
jgi:hypothetical protein